MTEIVRRDVVYRGYSTIETVTLRLPSGGTLTREVESHGRAVAVLPYDPVRKTALLVRQLRVPVKIASGQDDLLEACAGMIDGQDRVEDTVRREALEELGVKLGALEFVALAWPSSGVSTETMALYLAEYGPHDRIASSGGLAAEQEDITVEEQPLSDLVRLGEDGKGVDMKLLLLVQALRLRRPALFA